MELAQRKEQRKERREKRKERAARSQKDTKISDSTLVKILILRLWGVVDVGSRQPYKKLLR